ncbi:coenzyme F420-0:L-glutamate ligase [Candidatus Nitrosopelagicus sp.]|nr:coenzyme F420-0:L-glutamate ligase [Candidatus Nitrosopelagicus sp.]
MSLHIFPVHFKQDITPESNLTDILISSNSCGIEDDDIIVVSQKIVSKQEGRAINLDIVIPSELSFGIASAYDKDPKLVEVILSEAKRIVRMEHGVIIVQTKHGFICANAGIDESNVDGNYVTLLPKDPDNSAKLIQDEIRIKTGKKVAVIISDTFGRPFRLGQTDNAIGIAGIESILSYEGKHDTFGKILRVTAIAIVDELCSAAELVMGKINKSPMAIIKNFQFEPKDEPISNLIRPKSDDLFQ